MKQLIVLIATLILGLAIFALIEGFADPAENMQKSAINTMNKSVSSSAIN